MTRVSSFGHTQTLISELLRNQSELYQDQQQVNTGKVASDYKGNTISALSLPCR